MLQLNIRAETLLAEEPELPEAPAGAPGPDGALGLKVQVEGGSNTWDPSTQDETMFSVNTPFLSSKRWHETCSTSEEGTILSATHDNEDFVRQAISNSDCDGQRK